MPATKLDLPERALVVGAAGGIGGAVARHLVDAGTEVVGTDLGPAPDTWRGKWVTADISATAGHAAIADGVTEALGGFVFAAGVLDPEMWEKVDAEAAAKLLSINLTAPFFILRALLPLLADGASVVLIGSVAGARASPATPLYAASKAGLRNLAASLAILLQPREIRVNVVAPGLIDTALTTSFDATLAARQNKSVDEIRADRTAAIPMGRAGSVDEIADACLFLLSAQAGYITGTTLFATGGVLAGSI